MHVFYCGTEDFEVRKTGDSMASAIRDAVTQVDPALAARLAFDPESGGVEVGAPTERDLRVVLEVAQRSGLVSKRFVEGVEIDDLDLLEAQAGDDAEGHSEPYTGPMSIEAVTERGIVASFDVTSFPVGEAPGATVTELLDHARRTLGSHRWADAVRLSSTVDHVLVEAPDLTVLGRAAEVLGTLGLGSAPEMDVEFLQAARRDRSTGQPRDWVTRDDPDQPGMTIALGWSSDVSAVYLQGDAEEATATMKHHLATVDPHRAARVDLSLTHDLTVVLAGPVDDVAWAADALRAAAV
jgi:hypothetical protein